MQDVKGILGGFRGSEGNLTRGKRDKTKNSAGVQGENKGLLEDNFYNQ